LLASGDLDCVFGRLGKDFGVGEKIGGFVDSLAEPKTVVEPDQLVS
jgi:hypothetical protein